MTYDEFVEKLTWYFSRRDINELDRLAYESADAALREPDDVWNEINDGTWCNQNEYLRFAGRDFIPDLLRRVEHYHRGQQYKVVERITSKRKV